MDISEIVPIGHVLKREGELSAVQQLRVCAALLGDRQFEAAVDWLDPPLEANAAAPIYWLCKARALAGCGRFGMARDAALTALELSPHLREATELAATAGLAADLWSASRDEWTWSLARSLLDGCLALNAEASAMDVLRRALAHRPPNASGSVADIKVLAKKGLSLTDPEELRPLIEELFRENPGDAFLLALKIDCDTRCGRADQARSLAEAHESRTSLDKDLQWAIANAYQALGDDERAIQLLGSQSVVHERDHELLIALAFAVGEQVVRNARLNLPDSRPRKVFNLFPFNEELALLDIRLHEMADWVDHFVVVEAAETFTGIPKPLHFAENRARFEAFSSKILHVTIDRFPDFIDTPWAREFYQRDFAISALHNICGAKDIMLLTDADEIIDRRVLKLFGGEISSLSMQLFKYFLNYTPTKENSARKNRGGVICKARTLQNFGSSYLRAGLNRYNKDWYAIPDAGWHFTSVNSAAAVSRKFRGYSHQGASKAHLRDEHQVEAIIEAIRAGYCADGWFHRKVDARLPAFIVENRERFADLLL